nr:type II toxin-antitoxin system RelE/ParE family toxin [Jiella avicenniae]
MPSAQADLVRILTYVTHESGSLPIGRRFVDVLRRKCADLAGLPGMLGTPRPELRPDIRSFPFRGYVIFFRYVDDRTTF